METTLSQWPYLPSSTALSQRMFSLFFLPANTTTTCPRCPRNKREKYLGDYLRRLLYMHNIDINTTTPPPSILSPGRLYCRRCSSNPTSTNKPTNQTTNRCCLLFPEQELAPLRSDLEPLYCLFRGGHLDTQNFGPSPDPGLERASYVILHLPKRDLKRQQRLKEWGKWLKCCYTGYVGKEQ